MLILCIILPQVELHELHKFVRPDDHVLSMIWDDPENILNFIERTSYDQCHSFPFLISEQRIVQKILYQVSLNLFKK